MIWSAAAKKTPIASAGSARKSHRADGPSANLTRRSAFLIVFLPGSNFDASVSVPIVSGLNFSIVSVSDGID